MKFPRTIAYTTLASLLFMTIAPCIAGAQVATRNISRGPVGIRPLRKLSPELTRTSNSSGKIRVIIQTNGTPGVTQDDAIRAKGGVKQSGLGSVNTIVADVPADQLADLANRDDVAYVSADRPMKAQSLVGDVTGATQVEQGLTKLPNITGKNVTVAVIDSGISGSHPDFQKGTKSRILKSLDFTGSSTAGDAYGHGTGVAGVIGGNGAASKGYAADYSGIAPDANLIDLRVIDGNGTGSTSNTLTALNWAIDNAARYNIRVINMSVGGAIYESFRQDPVCQAVERAIRAGIVVVVAAGNNGHTTKIEGYDSNNKPIYQLAYASINSPANDPQVITVGAADSKGTTQHSDDVVADYSSKGPTQIDHNPKPDVIAPGTRIIAPMSQAPNPTFAAGQPQNIQIPTGKNALPNAYFKYSGTSFAAPVVSGIVALMLDANQSLTPVLVKAALMRTAQLVPGVTYGNRAQSAISQGAGQVNAIGAVAMARSIVTNADQLKAGDYIFRGKNTLTGLTAASIGGEPVGYNSHVSYAEGVLFSDHPILTNGIRLASNHIVSGGWIYTDGIMISDGLVRGDGIMIADGTVRGDGIMISDGIMMSDGIMISDGILLADGVMISDGIMIAEGIIIADGVTVSDGIILLDGIMISDGILITDGVIFSDGIVMTDGIILADGVMISDGILVADGVMISDGIMIADGILLGD